MSGASSERRRGLRCDDVEMGHRAATRGTDHVRVDARERETFPTGGERPPNAEPLRVAAREVEGPLPIVGSSERLLSSKHANASPQACSWSSRRSRRPTTRCAMRSRPQRCVILDGGDGSGDAPDASRGRRCPSALPAGGLRRDHDRTRRGCCALRRRRAAPRLDGLALRSVRLARQAIAEEGREGDGRRRVLDRRRHRPRGWGGDRRAAAARLRRRAARPGGARGPDRGAPDAVCDRRGAAGDRAPRLALLSPLSPRAVRGLRPALGRPGGRRVRARGAALRGARGQRAAAGLHPARPRRRDAVLPARLHRPAARRPPQPRLPHEQRLAASTPAPVRPSSRAWPWLARGGCAADRRLLRRGVRRDRRCARGAGRDAAGGTASKRRGSHELGGVRAAPPEPWVDAAGARCTRSPFPDLVARRACSSRRRARS